MAWHLSPGFGQGSWQAPRASQSPRTGDLANGWTSLRLHTEALQNCGVLSTLCTPTLVAEVASPLQPNTNMHKHIDTHLAGYKRLPTLSPWGLRDPKQSAEPWDASKFLSGALIPQARKERL